jgi:hypothetical protein
MKYSDKFPHWKIIPLPGCLTITKYIIPWAALEHDLRAYGVKNPKKYIRHILPTLMVETHQECIDEIRAMAQRGEIPKEYRK